MRSAIEHHSVKTPQGGFLFPNFADSLLVEIAERKRCRIKAANVGYLG